VGFYFITLVTTYFKTNYGAHLDFSNQQKTDIQNKTITSVIKWRSSNVVDVKPIELSALKITKK